MPSAPQQTPSIQPPRLLDQVVARVLHYRTRTDPVYVDWIKHYIVFFDKRHPKAMVASEAEAL